ncbi:MAG: DUF4097 family beta strand repeat protein [Ruminiclostridium sp.]|nr:DUF4097 family beta strand repeat protein [Ruminiclostridium sp.]
MKRLRVLKTAGIALAALGALMTAAGALLQINAEKDGYAGTVFTETAEFEAPRELVVITTDMPIRVSYGDTDTVKVTYTGGVPVIFTEKKGTLSMTQDDKFTVSLFTSRADDIGIEVILPHKVYERISLSSSSGSIEALSLGADQLEFGTKSGDLSLYGIDERASVRTDSGKVFAQFSSLTGDMTVKAGAGDVTLVMPDELSVYLEFFTESGSFTSERFDERYYEKYGDAAVIYNGAKHKLGVSTTSGDLFIK